MSERANLPPETEVPEVKGCRSKVRSGALLGLRNGTRGFLWIAKILVPVSLAVALLDWTGWLYALDPLFQPVMAVINLPPQAALPIIAAAFTSFYAGLAMIVAIPFTLEQVTLLAIFITICHMLIVEGLIQHKAGLNFLLTDLIRIFAAGLTVFVVSQFFPGTETPVVMPEALTAHPTLTKALMTWAVSTLQLLLKIVAIIIPVMVVLETMKVLGWTEKLATFFRPIMALLGLSPNVATMWVCGTFFGLIYGSAIITEEASSGRYTGDELRRLHISLGINHSIVEDPALFMALGANLFWILVPRIIAAAAAVHLYRLGCSIRTRMRRSSIQGSAVSQESR